METLTTKVGFLSGYTLIGYSWIEIFHLTSSGYVLVQGKKKQILATQEPWLKSVEQGSHMF